MKQYWLCGICGDGGETGEDYIEHLASCVKPALQAGQIWHPASLDEEESLQDYLEQGWDDYYAEPDTDDFAEKPLSKTLIISALLGTVSIAAGLISLVVGAVNWLLSRSPVKRLLPGTNVPLGRHTFAPYDGPCERSVAVSDKCAGQPGTRAAWGHLPGTGSRAYHLRYPL